MPRRIGVVTSAQAAAFADICRVLAARYPVAEIVLAHTLVQGVEAPGQIVDALARLAMLGTLEVIIVARGGGSLEDLWAFNEEAVARAIVACPLPVVTGIGHETDTTIADLAADLRAPTPTAAALAVTPDRQELLVQIAALHDDLRRALDERLRQERAQLAERLRELAYLHPARRMAQSRQRVDELDTVLRERALHHIDLHRERLQSRHAELALLDPRETLDRGFALVLDAEGRIVRGATGVVPGTSLRVRLRDGVIPVTVTGAVQPAS
jgi:exodeoxyribonuclease VII large subunit